MVEAELVRIEEDAADIALLFHLFLSLLGLRFCLLRVEEMRERCHAAAGT